MTSTQDMYHVFSIWEEIKIGNLKGAFLTDFSLSGFNVHVQCASQIIESVMDGIHVKLNSILIYIPGMMSLYREQKSQLAMLYLFSVLFGNAIYLKQDLRGMGCIIWHFKAQ